MIMDRGEAEVYNHIPKGAIFYYHSLRNVIFILLYQILHLVPLLNKAKSWTAEFYKHSKLVNHIRQNLIVTRNTCTNITSDSLAINLSNIPHCNDLSIWAYNRDPDQK